MRNRWIVLSSSLFLLICVASDELAGALVATAHADEAPVVMTQCRLGGSHAMPKGMQIFEQAREGRVIAQFTGAVAPMAATIPVDASGRAKVSTSAGKPTLRIDGWVQASAVPLYTSKDVPVVQGNVWIASGHRVTLKKGAAATLTGELTMQGTQNQSVQGTAGCDSFSIDRGRPSPADIPGNARGYLTKGSPVSLFESPGGGEVLTLNMAEGASQLFWSTETRGGFVRGKSRGDVVLDVWIKQRDLSALKKGEMMDQYLPPSTQVTGAQLSLEKPPRVLTASKDMPVRTRPDEKERAIGVIESGAEFYEMGVMGKWINAMPKDLHVSPASDAGFWVLAPEQK